MGDAKKLAILGAESRRDTSMEQWMELGVYRSVDSKMHEEAQGVDESAQDQVVTA